MQKPAILVKRYLNQLMLRVHPDFFYSSVNKRSANAASLQLLNDRLNPLLSRSSFPNALPSSAPTAISVIEFHLKPNDNNNNNNNNHNDIHDGSNSKESPVVKGYFCNS